MRNFNIIYLVMTCSLSGYMAMANDDVKSPVQQSIHYAIAVSHRARCTLTDGYLCAEIDKFTWNRRPKTSSSVPGIYMAAWEVCYAHFKALPDLSNEQKRLAHYSIGFAEDDKHYIIELAGLLLSKLVNEKPNGVILGSVGRG